jgi:hypothetical protein
MRIGSGQPLRRTNEEKKESALSHASKSSKQVRLTDLHLPEKEIVVLEGARVSGKEVLDLSSNGGGEVGVVWKRRDNRTGQSGTASGEQKRGLTVVLSPAVLENVGNLLDIEKNSSIVDGINLERKKGTDRASDWTASRQPPDSTKTATTHVLREDDKIRLDSVLSNLTLNERAKHGCQLKFSQRKSRVGRPIKLTVRGASSYPFFSSSFTPRTLTAEWSRSFFESRSSMLLRRCLTW